MKIVAGLGNPGPEYGATRHNVGWWLLDRMAYEWDLGAFERDGGVQVAKGRRGDAEVILAKPSTYMNRSGMALRPFLGREGFDVSADLLVVVDDAALEVGRVRARPGGSAGGHNGLRSIEVALGTDRYARLRIGVGRPPDGADMVEWVLSEMEPENEDRVVSLLPELCEAVGLWVREGVEPVMNRFNR